MDDGLRMVQARACGAWVLPGDPTCARMARRVFRRVAAGLALDTEAIDDGVTMVSELAANALHAQRRTLRPANPELWIYLRGTGQRAEIVCKVFDTLPAWVRGNVPGRTLRRAPWDATSGRGLDVVHELSGGRWGHHLSRSRLCGAGLPGKAVWFAMPAPVIGALTSDMDAAINGTNGINGMNGINGTNGRLRAHLGTATDAMTELEADLSSRGLRGKLVRSDDPGADISVLSVTSGLTIWCRSAAAWLRAPGIAVQQWSYSDLVEVGEQAVQVHEAIVSVAEPAVLAGASAARAGALMPARVPA